MVEIIGIIIEIPNPTKAYNNSIKLNCDAKAQPNVPSINKTVPVKRSFLELCLILKKPISREAMNATEAEKVLSCPDTPTDKPKVIPMSIRRRPTSREGHPIAN
jgi:hypothetical protein